MLSNALLIRSTQVGFAAAMYAWGWFFPEPVVLDGAGSVKKLPVFLKGKKIKNVLIVTDKNLMRLKALDGMLEELKNENIKFAIYDKVEPNPTIEAVEEATAMYNQMSCDGVIAFGGGSPIDCAKLVTARVARPSRPVRKMKGVFMVILPSNKMHGLFPPILCAVPTTHGTGSETTIAAVITDSKSHDKFPVMDPFIRAKCAVLDPELVVGLPPNMTSTTSMDALTHAVEGYTNIMYNNKKFDNYGIEAVKLVFEYVEKAYNNPTDLEARSKLLLASYYAGLCFTRGGVGYVHGIGHRLGGLYGVPHGLAMATILPHVFSEKLLGPFVQGKLAKLADAVGIRGTTDKEKAHAFVEEIAAMNERMNIPSGFDCIKKEDISLIAKRALEEINPTYPVPKLFNQSALEEFIEKYLIIKK